MTRTRALQGVTLVDADGNNIDAATLTGDGRALKVVLVDANGDAVLQAPASATEQLTGTATDKASTPDSVAALWEKGGDIASAATISVGEGGFFHVTGTTTITDIDFDTTKAGRKAWLVFDGALILTHHSTTLILPGGANITTAAGDAACFVSEGGDNVRCVAYIPKDGGTVTSAIPGTATNNNAAAGDIGEAITGTVVRASATGLVTGTSKTVTSIVLTAGDWDLSGGIGFLPAATTVIASVVGTYHTVTNALPASVEPSNSSKELYPAAFAPNDDAVFSLPAIRVSLSATTTYYLIATAYFSTNTLAGYGFIQGRRAR